MYSQGEQILTHANEHIRSVSSVYVQTKANERMQLISFGRRYPIRSYHQVKGRCQYTDKWVGFRYVK